MVEVVMLHHVRGKLGDEVGPLAEYAVTPTQLDEYLESRSDWKSVSSLHGLKKLSSERKFLLTFDDGYKNNLTEALPVLEKHDASCVLFITTGFIEGEVYPYELEMAEVIEKEDVINIPGQKDLIRLDHISDCRSIYEELRLPLKRRSHVEREEFMKQLAKENGYQRENMQSVQFLSWSEIQTLSEHPLVTIGAHTHTHLLLSCQSWKVGYREMRRSKDRLETVTGKKVVHFSYPYGGNTLALRQMARWIGFRYAYTTEPELLKNLNWLTRIAIPRIDINEFVQGNE